MDRLTSLTAFVRVVDNGGFSAAGRRLNMSVTMVSNHVQSLEDRLAVRLLNRTTRKVSLTEIGKAYYERCVQILAELEEADHLASELNTSPRGTLRIHIGTHLARYLAPVVSEYLALYPGVSVNLTIGDAMIDLVAEGIELAIRPTPPPDSSLIARRLVAWRHILCATPAYLERHGVPARLEDLQHLSAACGHNQRRHRSRPRQIDFKEMAAPTSEEVNHRTRARLTWPLSVICTGMR